MDATMHTMHILTRRADSQISPALLDGIIALLVLIFVALLCTATLFTLRRLAARRADAARSSLPLYNEISHARSTSNHKRLTISASSICIHDYDEKSLLTPKSMPSTPCLTTSVPEIRITFPDEQDESGRRQSGRVVIVRVGEHGIGLEPVSDEQLPRYERETGSGENGRFASIDLDRIGGLKEKSEWS